MLHTYFKGDPRETKITGLSSEFVNMYDLDKAKQLQTETATLDEIENGVTPYSMTRIYLDSPDDFTITPPEGSGRSKLIIKQTGMKSVTLWSPSLEQDVPDIPTNSGERERFFCAERGLICDRKKLAKGESYDCSHSMAVVADS